MMNGIWCGMIVIGVVYGVLTGNVAAVTNAAIDSSKEAVSLCITMLGVMAMWNGLMEIATQADMIRQISDKMSPLLSYLFPKIPKSHQARQEIATNFIANLLGLGWAATPAGLRAMTELKKLQEERCRQQHTGWDYGTNKTNDTRIIQNPEMDSHVAGDEMCTFLILNISSLQLIPINIIAYRSQYGSINPAAVILPGIIATCVSTVTAILFCKMMQSNKKT